MKNVDKLSRMLGGPRISYDTYGKNCQKNLDANKKRKYESSRRGKMLTPRYHLKPQEYMLEHEVFDESSKE